MFPLKAPAIAMPSAVMVTVVSMGFGVELPVAFVEESTIGAPCATFSYVEAA